MLGSGDAIVLYSDSSIKWHIASVHFLGGGDLTAAPLVVGNRYEIVNFTAADVFTNVGAASNALSVKFTATGTAPTTWTATTILRDLGAGVINV